jgi:hypothetical protein
LQAVPPADRHKVVAAAHHAFVTGFNTIAMVSVAVAAVGCVAGYALVRSRDFVGARPGGGPAGASTGVGGGRRLRHPPRLHPPGRREVAAPADAPREDRPYRQP